MDRTPPADWPFRADAGRHRAAGQDWWLIDTGKPGDQRPVALLLHGAGGSGHSFRALIPLLRDRFRLIVPDLPGQGFTRPAPGMRFGLEPIATAVEGLCLDLDLWPEVIIGHSAGSAVALYMAQSQPTAAVVGINAALGSFEGAAGILFPLLARVLSSLPLVPFAFSRLWGNPMTVNRLLASTGSSVDAEGQRQYLTLVRRADHVEGTLAMMAAWQLDGLLSRLPDQTAPCLLIAAEDDGTVPARVSRAAASRHGCATCLSLPKGGHLVHESDPQAVAKAILTWLDAQPSA